MSTPISFTDTSSPFGAYLNGHGIRPSWVADQLGVHRMKVTRWAQGKTHPTLDEAEAIAVLLNVPRTRLFPRVTEHTRSVMEVSR